MGTWRYGAVAVVACGLLCGGCTQNRANDAKDMFEIGITTTSTAQFAFLPIDYWNSLTLGYSSVDGNYYGIGNRKVGKMRFYDRKSWGVFFWGQDTLRIGEFDPNDPHLAWVDEMTRLKLEGKPLPTERPDYSAGLVTLLTRDNSPPRITYMQCRRNFHFGWVGFHLAMRPLDMIDFLLGLTGLDILGDDVVGKPDVRAAQAKPAPEVKK